MMGNIRFFNSKEKANMIGFLILDNVSPETHKKH